MTTSIDNCDICMAPIESNETRYGHGDGTGNKFAHYGCYWREQAEIEKKRADAAEAQRKIIWEAYQGLRERFAKIREMCNG